MSETINIQLKEYNDFEHVKQIIDYTRNFNLRISINVLPGYIENMNIMVRL